MESDEQIRSSNNHGPLQIRVGELTQHRAFVYTEVVKDVQSIVREISGQVRGPFSAYSTTLPTTHKLQLMESSGRMIMGTYITDPCLWSPEQPMFYVAEMYAVYKSGDEIRYPGYVGLRQFSAQGKSLYLNGKRWVLRAAFDHDRGPTGEIQEWKPYFTARVCVWRQDRVLFADASRLGVLIVAEQIGMLEDSLMAFRAMARQPSIGIALLLPDAVPPDNARKEFPSILLAQRIQTAEMLASWAQLAWINVDHIDEFAKLAAHIPIPIIAVRRYRGDSLAEARAAIDQLQADLAPIGQFAGYVV